MRHFTLQDATPAEAEAIKKLRNRAGWWEGDSNAIVVLRNFAAAVRPDALQCAPNSGDAASRPSRKVESWTAPGGESLRESGSDEWRPVAPLNFHHRRGKQTRSASSHPAGVTTIATLPDSEDRIEQHAEIGPACIRHRSSINVSSTRRSDRDGEFFHSHHSSSLPRSMNVNRPLLREIPLSSVVLEPGVLAITINVGAWDALIKASYERGFILIEIENETAVRAFKKNATDSKDAA